MAMISMDAEIMRRLPSFIPFGALSPAISLLDESLAASREFLTCHGARAREHAKTVVTRLSEPDRAGLDETAARSLKYAMLYMLGAMDAFDGRPNALEHVAEFENTPGYRGTAWRVRRVAHLMQGDFEAAEECHRRAELFELLDGQEQAFPGTVIRIEASAHWMIGDLAGLKEAIERIAEIAALYPTWQSTLDMARCHYFRLQGHADAAIEAILPALERSRPGRDPDWVWVTAAHVSALTAAGKYDEAARLGREYVSTARREALSPPMRCLVKPVAEALVRAGHLDEAQALCDDSLEDLEADGVRGLWLGLLYEARALVAIARGDESAFERDAARCATEYRRGKNSTLVANYERLMREAARHALRVPEKLARAVERAAGSTTTYHEHGAVMNSVAIRLAACQNASERAQEVLVALMEHSGAEAGYLYGLRQGRATCSAALPSDIAVPSSVEAFVERYVREHLDDSEEETKSLFEGETRVDEDVVSPNIETEAGTMFPIPLMSSKEGAPVLAAVAVLRLARESRPPNQGLLDALARSLIAHGDVDASSS
jgi:hypothetical protein